MMRWDAWAFPDGETHLPKRMQKFNVLVAGLDGMPRQTYQYPLYQQAVAACLRREVAVDVGAHVGLFSYWMVRDFAQVVAFEPVEAHRICWVANVPARPVDVLYGCALGAREGAVRMETPIGSSGGTRIGGPGATPLCTLDAFSLPVVSLLKIDCEGYELEVLQGADATIRRCHPTVCVEQRPKQVSSFGHGQAEAVQWLQQRGAVVRWTDRRDYVLGWA
jgi:FkbM family methyltransferase